MKKSVRPISLLTVLCATFATTSGLALARAPADDRGSLPPPVAEYLAQAERDCPAGFRAGHAVQTVDLTGEGQPGYVIDPHKMSCAGSPHLFGGTGPASIELFVTLPSGKVAHRGGVLALSYTVDPAPAGGPPVLEFVTHNTAGPGSIDSYRWAGHEFNLINHRPDAGAASD
jgi:hypothetical protein